ncbi:unnamed protein product, partial [Ectocarpus fasciculatus]
KGGSCLSEIQRMQRERDERRRNAEERKQERLQEEKRNRDNGNFGDVDFVKMIRDWREDAGQVERRHSPPGSMKICICVRKRPINSKEIKKRDHDSVSCLNPAVHVHACKLKVDGITKYLDNQSFQFDHTFGEDDTTDDVYMYTAQPLVDYILRGGRATIFAYGQTGSGKTFTMVGIQKSMADDLFYALQSAGEDGGGTPLPVDASTVKVSVAFFEIYGGRCQDLLNHRNRLTIREDGTGEVVIGDLEEMEVQSAEDMMAVIDMGNQNRTTHATESNDVSSRSHAICQVMIRKRSGRDADALYGKLSLIDLAGSERAADTMSNNRQRRMEGSEINKSLLALKECIRALADNTSSRHVPYRASKLTLVLKDSFTRDNARTVMIAAVSPAVSSADHTINTLRYADRVKERTVTSGGGGDAAEPKASVSPPARRASPVPSASVPQPPRAQPAARERERDRESKHTPPPLVPSQAGGRGGGRAGIAGSNGRGRDQAPSDVELAAALNDAMRMEDARGEEEDDEDIDELLSADVDRDDLLSRTVENLFDEEEALLNMHMGVIQENAELLTEEGRLLQQIQGADVQDYDIDAYAARLDQILRRKQELIGDLQRKLAMFRKHLKKEEKIS